jgi:hypothetical protein
MIADYAPDDINTWKDAVELAIDAAAQIDIGRYIIGDVSILVQAHYGENEIGRFADEINVDAKRVQEYRTVCKFFPPQIRSQFSELPISYSHFREAMRLKDLEEAIDFLHECALNLWRVRDARDEIKKRMGDVIPERPIIAPNVRFEARKCGLCIIGAEGLEIDPLRRYKMVLTPIEGD